MTLFELDRRDVSDPRMPTMRVVPALDEIEYGQLRLGLVTKSTSVQQFALQGSKEALAHSVGESHQLHPIATLQADLSG